MVRGGSRICGRGGGRSGYRERRRREGFWRVPFEDPLWNFKRGGGARPLRPLPLNPLVLVAFTPRPIPIPTSVADTDVGEAIRTCSIFQISVTDVFGDRAIPVCLDGRKPHRRRCGEPVVPPRQLFHLTLLRMRDDLPHAHNAP